MKRWISFIGAVSVFAFALNFASVAQASPVNAYVDEFGSLDVGEQTYHVPDPPGAPALPQTLPLLGPVSTGAVHGQFEFDCNDSQFDPSECDGADDFAAREDWGWGVVDATDFPSLSYAGLSLVSNGGGETFFHSSYANEGFGLVTPGLVPNAAARYVKFHFDLEDSDTGMGGVVLLPDRTYVLFAARGDTGLLGLTYVPGSLDGPGPQIEVYTAATSDQPYQFASDPASNFIDNSGSGLMAGQVATSRLIPIIVPEPATLALLFVGVAALVKRRNR